MARAAWLLLVASCWSGNREPVSAQSMALPDGDEIVVRDARRPDELVVDDHHVYWLGGSDDNAGLWRADKRPGSTATLLAKAAIPVGLALDETSVYWGNTSAIFAMPKAGGEPRLVARIPRPDLIGGIAVYPDRIVAVTGDPDRDESVVWRFVRSSNADPAPIALDGDFEAMVGNARGVHVATVKGLFAVDHAGFVKTLLRDEAVSAVAVDRQHVYFSTRDSDPQVLRLPGTRAAPDVPKRLDSAKGLVVAMASGPKFVYWSTHTDNEDTRAVYRIGKRGGWRERLAPIRDAGSFAVDATHVYWSDTGRGRIVRRRLGL